MTSSFKEKGTDVGGKSRQPANFELQLSTATFNCRHIVVNRPLQRVKSLQCCRRHHSVVDGPIEYLADSEFN